MKIPLWKVALAGAVFGWVWATGALAQQAPDPLTIKVTRQQLMAIGQGLQELPAKVANPILNDLQAQLNAADEEARKAAGKAAEPEQAPKPAQ